MHDQNTIFLVDDDVAVLKLFENILVGQGFQVRSYLDGYTFMADYRPTMPGCAVIDLKMPKISGEELFETIKSKGWTIPVIIATAYASVSSATDLIRRGAHDLIEKPVSQRSLLEKVRSALAYDADLRQASRRRHQSRQLIDRLTTREQQVLDLLIEGLSSKQIARHLHVSSRTAEGHRSRVMNKTETDSMAGLVLLAVNAGRIEVATAPSRSTDGA